MILHKYRSATVMLAPFSLSVCELSSPGQIEILSESQSKTFLSLQIGYLTCILIVYCHAVAKRLFPLILFPYLKKMYGKGIMATVRKASSEVAH